MDPITEEVGRRAAEGWDAILVAALGRDLATLVETAILAAFAIMALLFGRYVLLLSQGGKPEGSKERRDYVELRDNLNQGGWPAKVYRNNLTALLNGVDRFFLDVDNEGKPNWRMSAFPRAFGLQTPAALWTGAAYDRCLLIALLYPIACIFAIWAISGHVGPAEAALQLPADSEAWRRGALLGGAALGGLASWRSTNARGWARWLWLAVAVAVAVAGAVAAGAGAVALAFGFVFFVTGAGAGAFAVAGAGAITVASTLFASAVAVAVAVTRTFAGAGASAVAVAVACAFAGASFLSTRYKHHGAFLSLFSPLMLAATLAFASYAGAFAAWETAGPLALFLGLLTLINAPFDWLSLGVTRGLLRRGVELGGLWPYALGFVDLALALVLVAGLAATMTIGVQAFEYLAALQGAVPILPLAPLFAGIEKNPGAPEYWWIYATLFSTLIPSVFNLVMGSWSLFRGLPFLSRLCVSRMPEDAATPIYDRAWIATVLTLQWLFGLLLTVAGMAALGWGLLPLFPQIGAAFLGWAEFVASWNVPQRINEWALGMLGR